MSSEPDTHEASGGEVWFYHLERSGVEQILPELLARCAAQGWRSLVSAGERVDLDSLSRALWSSRPDSFIAHGLAGDAHDARQPVLLSHGSGNVNDAQALFILGGANLPDVAPYARTFVLFDGRIDSELEWARSLWRHLREAHGQIAYWKQSQSGRWEKTA